MLPSGLRAKTSEPPRTSVVNIWQKIFLGDCLLEVQCPIAETRVITVLITHVFCANQMIKKNKKRGGVRIP